MNVIRDLIARVFSYGSHNGRARPSRNNQDDVTSFRVFELAVAASRDEKLPKYLHLERE